MFSEKNTKKQFNVDANSNPENTTCNIDLLINISHSLTCYEL